jgi:hypothetical protein
MSLRSWANIAFILSLAIGSVVSSPSDPDVVVARSVVNVTFNLSLDFPATPNGQVLFVENILPKPCEGQVVARASIKAGGMISASIAMSGNFRMCYSDDAQGSTFHPANRSVTIIRPASNSSVTSLSMGHVIVGTPAMMQFVGADFSPYSFIAFARAGNCNSARISTIPLSTGTINQSDFVYVPAFNQTGAFKVCLSTSGVQGPFFEQLWVQLSAAAITGVTASSTFITQTPNTNGIQLTCTGDCFGSRVRIGLMPAHACDCGVLVGGLSIPYTSAQHTGRTPAVFGFTINQTGTYRVCWSPDDGETFFSQTTAAVRAVSAATHTSISAFSPYYATKLVSSSLTFIGAQYSPLSYIAFVQKNDTSCSHTNVSVPVTCEMASCDDEYATLRVTIPYWVPPGTYRICYSTSGPSGRFFVQTSLQQNLTIYERECPAYLCEPGEFYVTGQIAPFGASCMRCTPGTYSRPGDGNCTECPRGHSCADPSRPPQPCQQGYFSLVAGAVTCEPCPVRLWSMHIFLDLM